jgi:hypothetical protein
MDSPKDGSKPEPAPKSLRRVAAGRENRSRRGPLTEEGRERLRMAALRDRPWEHATGPRTDVGKAQAVQNGKRRQVGPRSVRKMRAELAAVRALLQDMRTTRRQLEEPGGA